jgi:hypothetical protein
VSQSDSPFADLVLLRRLQLRDPSTKSKGRASSSKAKAPTDKGKALDRSGQAPVMPSSFGGAGGDPAGKLIDEQRVELATKSIVPGQ